MGKTTARGMKARIANGRLSESARIARNGLYTSRQLCAYLSALAADLSAGEESARIAHAVACVIGKLLRTVELEQKWGVAQSGDMKSLQLVDARNA